MNGINAGLILWRIAIGGRGSVESELRAAGQSVQQYEKELRKADKELSSLEKSQERAAAKAEQSAQRMERAVEKAQGGVVKAQEKIAQAEQKRTEAQEKGVSIEQRAAEAVAKKVQQLSKAEEKVRQLVVQEKAARDGNKPERALQIQKSLEAAQARVVQLKQEVVKATLREAEAQKHADRVRERANQGVKKQAEALAQAEKRIVSVTQAQQKQTEAIQRQQQASQAAMAAVQARMSGLQGGMVTAGREAMPLQYAAAMQGFAMDMTLRFSLLSALVTGFITNSAVKFNASMTDVRRTSGITRQEMDELGRSFLNMSKSLPTENAAQALADIAVVAGKAGLQAKGDIEQFTFGVNKLTSVFDNLDPAETATKMNQILQAFRIPLEDVERVGSIISEIDNATSASTKELITFTQMIAGAAQVAGVSLPAVVALAGTVKDLGMRTETSATAFGRLFQALATKPEKFAKIIGTTTEEFRKMVEEDATGAIIKWAQAIAALGNAEGAKTLTAMGFAGQRTYTTLALLTKNIDRFRENLEKANEEERNNISLNRQWAVINEKVESSLNRTLNKGKALGIELGQRFFPVLEQGLGILTSFIAMLNSLPPGVQNFAFALGIALAVIGPMSLMLGNVLRLFADLRNALRATVVAFTAARTASLGFSAAIATLSASNVVLLAATAAALVFSTAMAVMAGSANRSAEELNAMNQEARQSIQKQIDHNRSIITLSNSLKELESSTASTSEKERMKGSLYRQSNRLLPGLIDNTTLLSEAIQKVGEKASEAKKDIQQFNDALRALNETEVNMNLVTLEKELDEARKDLDKKLIEDKSFITPGLIFPDKSELNQEMRRVLTEFNDVLKHNKPRGEGIFDFFRVDLKDVNLEAAQLRIARLITFLNLMRTKLSEPNSELNRMIAYLSDVSIKIGAVTGKKREVDQLSETLKSFASGNTLDDDDSGSGSGDEVDPFKELREKIELQAKRLDFAKTVLANIRRELEEEGGKTKGEVQLEVQEAVFETDNLAAGFKKGGNVLASYNAETEKYIKLLRTGAQSLSGTKDELEYRIKLEETLRDLRRENRYDLRAEFLARRESEIGTIEGLTKILKLQEERYENQYRDAKQVGLESQFLQLNEKSLAAIEDRRRGINDRINEQLYLLTGEQNLIEASSDILASAIEKLTDPKTKDLVEKLIELNRSMKRGERKTDKETDTDKFEKQFNQMGATADNTFGVLMNGWRSMSQRIVDMAWDMRLSLKDVWDSIAKDFMAMILDELFKNVFKKGIMGLLTNLFGGGPVGAISSGGDGGSMFGNKPFGGDVGSGLLESMAKAMTPNVVSPQFATVPNYTINVPSPVVNMGDKAPVVNVHLHGTMDGQTFLRKNEPVYSDWKSTRRLAGE